MSAWWWKSKRQSPERQSLPVEDRIRTKYHHFRELLSLNSECLELMAGLQEDLQFVPPRRDVVETRITSIFEKAAGIVVALERLTGTRIPALTAAVESQQNEVERYIAALQELTTPRLSAWLFEVNADHVSEVGGKAAMLGEIKNKLGLPVPDGYALTTEAYRQFCGIPLWHTIRDAIRNADLSNPEAMEAISTMLVDLVMECPMPRVVEVAVADRARTLDPVGAGLAVRSSAWGEGGERGGKTYAGQFLSLINVLPEQAVDAYKRVVAGRFSERALFYRLSTGVLEVESPIAVLVLPVIRAKASGIMYTRDPADPKSKALWVTATRGLGLEIATGRMPADLFVVSRKRPYTTLDSNIVHKEEQLVSRPGGGVERIALDTSARDTPSLEPDELRTLAEWGVLLEDHFKTPQDVEWVVDENGKVWIVQSRSLALVQAVRARNKARPRGDPALSGGRTIYPGRVSGPAHLVEELKSIRKAPEGAVVFLRRPSPEIVQVLPRIGGLVAEWGNVAGHAAALLREFRVPSVFSMMGAFEQLKEGETVSLDSVMAKVYPGAIWPSRVVETEVSERYREKGGDAISRRLLTLHLLDAQAHSFRPAGCKSTHDVLRFCHEKAVEAMFAVSDIVMGQKTRSSKELETSLPVNLQVLDLGGGLALDNPASPKARPEQIVSRPFQALWKGVIHPQVSWTRDMPASLGDLASVMAGSFTPQGRAMRALGEKSYLLVADEYMNLNSRLAYHFSLVDACLSDIPSSNYVSFRFAGGGATRQRRSLRACFVEACLGHYGFLVDRRSDLVNAWYKKGPPEETEAKLDILGRLMACTSQLDMYMSSYEVMKWYVRQFLEGNYSFRVHEDESVAASPQVK